LVKHALKGGVVVEFASLIVFWNTLERMFAGMASMLSFIILELGLRKCNANGPRTGSPTFAVGNIFIEKYSEIP
jgi:hypothetical protein